MTASMHVEIPTDSSTDLSALSVERARILAAAVAHSTALLTISDCSFVWRTHGFDADGRSFHRYECVACGEEFKDLTVMLPQRLV